jgi:hypothetical protein
MLLVKGKTLLPVVLMLAFAVSRIPGLLGQNFSAAYALLFCAGVYFPKRLVWWLPMATMFVTDILLNVFYYHVAPLHPEMVGNYLTYGALVFLGRKYSPRASWLSLLGGGLLGAIVFYLVSNTFAWFFNPFHNPEYTKTLTGWLIALTHGTAGYMQTWEFFRNTLMSGGLFTGLFAGAMKLLEAPDPAEDAEPAEEKPEEQPQEQPAEAKAQLRRLPLQGSCASTSHEGATVEGAALSRPRWNR